MEGLILSGGKGTRLRPLTYTGRGVKIHRLPLKPVAHRFMLGDNSEVWIEW